MVKSDPMKEKSQPAKFRAKARELEADESEEAFNAALKRVAKAPAPKPAKERKAKR
jgi:hypothetical protein